MRNEVAELRKRPEPVENAAPTGGGSSLPAKKATLPEALYRNALNAFDRKQWSDAAKLFDSAARQAGDSNETVRISSLRFEAYLPNYYLGMAYKELGRCRDAIAAWTVSEDQRAVQATPLYRRLQDARGTCQSKK